MNNTINGKFYRAAYDFHKRWTPYPKDLKEWDAMLNEACAVTRQNGSDPLLVSLIVSVIEDLERESKGVQF